MRKLGSKENPIQLGLYEIEDLRKILAEGDSEYDKLIHQENPDRAAEIREQYRARILKRWPMLYDHAHVEYGWMHEKDYWRDQMARHERPMEDDGRGGVE